MVTPVPAKVSIPCPREDCGGHMFNEYDDLTGSQWTCYLCGRTQRFGENTCWKCGHRGYDVHEQPTHICGRDTTEYFCDNIVDCLDRSRVK